METVGVWLRQAREAKGSTLEEAADATRIRPRFLEALETGDFTIFSVGEVQIRGFLRIYARYLDLSPEEILARHDAEGHGGEAASSSEESAKAPPASSSRPTTTSTRPQPRSITAPTARPRQINLEKLMVAGLVLIVLLAIVAGVGYVVSRNNGGSRRSAVLPATATTPPKTALAPEAVDEPVSSAATPTLPASSASSEGGVTLTLDATEHVWTRVKSDNRTVFEGMMASGQAETWSGQEMIVVETGNGAGLQVSVNGQPQGTMCARAQVCTRAWGPMGEIDTP
jgi:cytoskeletal protein RodZ